MSNNLIGRIKRYTSLVSVVLNSKDNANGEKDDKQEKCVVSIYENPKVTHISSFCIELQYSFLFNDKM